MKTIQKMRRDLHQIPELDRNLPKTIAYLKAVLKPLRCELHEPTPGSLIAYFHFNQTDTLAYRSDMDALSIMERSHVSYRSKHKGRMHACGHDGHMAMLLGFAQAVDELPCCRHNILLIFQPAEESSGGAKDIVDTGLFARYHVKAIFGFHLWPTLPDGVIASKPGALMAQSAEIDIEIRGKAAHIAKAADAQDALQAAVMLFQLCEQLRFQIPAPYLLSFGHMKSGDARNVISDYTLIQGTLRTYEETIHQDIKNRLHAIKKRIEQQTQCCVSIHISDGYPPVINDPDLFAQCRKILPHLQVLEKPNLLSEDFSFYGKAVPALFLYLGIGSETALHADTFDFDDSLLVKGVETYLALLQL